MKRIIILLILISAICYNIATAAPIEVETDLKKVDEKSAVLTVKFKIEKDHLIYNDMLKIDVPENVSISPDNVPAPKKKKDPFSGEEKEVYEKDFTATYNLEGIEKEPVKVIISYQGCDKDTCFMPETKTFTLYFDKKGEVEVRPAKTPEKISSPTSDPSDWKMNAGKFKVIGTATGYMDSKKFIAFLDNTETGKGMEKSPLAGKSIWITIVLILLGGLALNLTPCVLPLIPINLMIIGAGAQASSKKQGFLLGGIYGLGISLVYGILGLVVVLTGSKFGSINSSPWFNLAIAIIFILLSLAMFDVFLIDFTKFGSKLGKGESKKGSFFAALFMGAISALLAGACVAPVVISVLLLSSMLYANGNIAGLFLPFLLGIGMAIPWPFAGAGLSFLPKPGKWMDKVKHVFGIIIILFALYYGHTAYILFRPVPPTSQVTTEEGWVNSLSEGLKTAEKENKLVFIDFWASWCKNCTAMDKGTFKDPEVRKRMEKYVKIKYRAEKPNVQPTKEVLDYYNAIGLPTYVILKKSEVD
ncbi:MAG: thioredoxin family protein [Candidatus Eremiobacteraeota bacterium]|nr:thioredoxin family protein [Candidatus Eremiobacteraeota bacterium]